MSDKEEEKNNKFQENARIIKIRDYLLETYDFRFNEVTLTNEYRVRGEDSYKNFDSRFKSDLIIELKTLKFSKPKEDLEDILHSSLIPIYNPIKDYFSSIEFKGEGFIKKFASYFTLENLKLNIDQPYETVFEEYLTKWLMASYLCSTTPIVNDVMLILIGGQGTFKTSILNFLTPPALIDYRVTGHLEPSLNNIITSSHLATKFMINVDDQMETLAGGLEFNKMKAIISIADLSMRKYYTTDFNRRMRIANFCGSVNNTTFLRDISNRRYLCFQLKAISKDYNKIDIDSMWAEVKFLASKLQTNYIWGKKEFEMIEDLNLVFSKATIEEDIFLNLFERVNDDTNPDEIYYLSYSDIMKVMKQYSGDNSLKDYNIQHAQKKHKMDIAVSKRLGRFTTPRKVYPLKLATSDQLAISLLSYYKTTVEPSQKKEEPKQTKFEFEQTYHK